MRFNTEEAREKFLQDKAFFESRDSYCLGETMEEAGEILKKIVEGKEQDYVGLDDVGIE